MPRRWTEDGGINSACVSAEQRDVPAVLNTIVIRAGMPEDEVKELTKGRANIRQWMQVNQDWKSRCSDPKRFQKYQEEATLRLLFPHYIAGEGLKFDVVAGRFLKLKSVDERFYDTASDEHKMRIADLVGHYLISIRNSRGVMRFAMHGDSFEDLLEELKVEPSATEELDDEGFTESSYLKLKFLRHPDAIFGNPVFATELGLAEVVQFLIEEKGLDVNGSWNGLYVWNQPHSLPLTACGLCPDISVLNYLLNVPGANFGFRLASWPGSTHLDGGTLVHWLITQSDTERHQMERIEAVLGHRTVDINAQLPSNDITALHLLCMGNHTIGDIDKMRLLLNHGADIYSATSEESGGITPLEFLYMFKVENNECWVQKVALLMQASGASNEAEVIENFPFLSRAE